MKKLATLTGGGDCPGLNAVIRAVTRKALLEGYEVIGFKNGWAGVIKGEFVPLSRERVSGILHLGGTILGTSRTNPTEEQIDIIIRNLKGFDVTALIAIGGDDTLSVASRLHKRGVPVIGVPKTIDNDIDGTDQTSGFDTAVNIATEAIDRLHTTAEAHSRVLVVEVMGRQAGWIAWESGIAGGADLVLLPEFPMTLEAICKIIKQRQAGGKNFSIVAVAEGFKLDGSEVTQSRNWIRSATSGWAASVSSSAARSRKSPGSKAAPSCSATCSAAARRAPTIARSARATASRPSNWPRRASSARWPRCAAPRLSASIWTRSSPR